MTKRAVKTGIAVRLEEMKVVDFEEVKIGKVRALTVADLKLLSSHHHAPLMSWSEVCDDRVEPEAQSFFVGVEHLLDYFLEPDSAEDAIANLNALYRRRLAKDPAHAKRWLIAQAARIIYGRAIEALRMFSAARARK
jgi:hypothetical protein